MKTRISYWCIGLIVAISTPAVGEIHRLDFGTDESPLRPGFERVTAAIGSAGDGVAGWAAAADLEAVDIAVPREPFPPPIYTTDLRRDSVQGRETATLRVKTAPGRYVVWALVGTGGGGWSQVWNIRVSNPRSGDAAEATFFGGHTARILTFSAAAGDDAVLDIEVATRSRWAVNAMLIVPEDEWPPLRASEIAGLEREVLLLPDEVLRNWEHTPHVPREPLPEYTDAERARGFVIYSRPWVTPIWPNTNPRRDEFDPTLKAFLSPREYEPLTFTVMPLRDLELVDVKLPDLRSDDGAVIPADDLELRYVQYKIVRPNYKTFGTYYRAPDLLPRFAGRQPLTAGENFRVWVTVHAREGAAAATYRGSLRLMFADGGSAEVPLVVRVLPIQLKKDSRVTYSTYYRHPSRYLKEAPDEFSRQWWQRKVDADATSMAAHGYNGFRPDISAGFSEDGQAVANLEKWGHQLEIARRHGMDVDRPTMGDLRSAVRSLYVKYMGSEYPLHLFNVEMPPDAFFDQITQLVAAVEAERKSRGLPELLYSLVDEPASSEAPVAFTRRLYEAAKQVPGIRTFVTVDPSREGYESLHGVVDVWTSPFLNRPGVDREALAHEGIEVWCYPNSVAGENDHTPVAGARMTYGFARWRAGIPGMMPWIFESWGGDPENNLDALQSDMFNHTADDAEVLPCTLYEAYREGIDDNRYITTLERKIEAAHEVGLSAEADAAQKDLEYVREAVPIREIYQYDTGWSDDSFDVYRWIVARRILMLQDAIDASAAKAADARG